MTQPALGSPPFADPVVASRCTHVRWVAHGPIYTYKMKKWNCHFRERRETRTREVPKGPEDVETDLHPSRSATARGEHHNGTPMRGCKITKSAKPHWHPRAPRDKTPQREHPRAAGFLGEPSGPAPSPLEDGFNGPLQRHSRRRGGNRSSLWGEPCNRVAQSFLFFAPKTPILTNRREEFGMMHGGERHTEHTTRKPAGRRSTFSLPRRNRNMGRGVAIALKTKWLRVFADVRISCKNVPSNWRWPRGRLPGSPGALARVTSLVSLTPSRRSLAMMLPSRSATRGSRAREVSILITFMLAFEHAHSPRVSHPLIHHLQEAV